MYGLTTDTVWHTPGCEPPVPGRTVPVRGFRFQRPMRIFRRYWRCRWWHSRPRAAPAAAVSRCRNTPDAPRRGPSRNRPDPPADAACPRGRGHRPAGCKTRPEPGSSGPASPAPSGSRPRCPGCRWRPGFRRSRMHRQKPPGCARRHRPSGRWHWRWWRCIAGSPRHRATRRARGHLVDGIGGGGGVLQAVRGIVPPAAHVQVLSAPGGMIDDDGVLRVAAVTQERIPAAALLTHVMQHEIGRPVIDLRADGEGFRTRIARDDPVRAGGHERGEIEPGGGRHLPQGPRGNGFRPQHRLAAEYVHYPVNTFTTRNSSGAGAGPR